MNRQGRVVCIGALTLLISAGPAAASSLDRERLDRRLERLARQAGGASGVVVRDLDASRELFSWRSGRRRVLASNTKMFTTATALASLGGPERRLKTSVHAGGTIAGRRLEGNLYLVGAGDPSLNDTGFRKAGIPHTPITPLAIAVKRAGIRKVTGRLVADDSIFDRIRGVPYSSWATSGEIGGPLGGLTWNSARGASDPALAAAKAFRRKLRKVGVKVKRVKLGRLPAGLRTQPPLGSTASPPLKVLIRRTNRASDNFFAEMLLKRIWARPGRRKGTTRGGAKAVEAFASRLGIGGVKIADGSGLSSGNKAAPEEVVALLAAMRGRSTFKVFRSSLPAAGRQGTLAGRMRGTPAENRCRAKTGTLSGVSTLSGYCRAREGRLLAFSILMNGVDVLRAHRAQDRMVTSIARYRP